jgi:hydrogenase/urease accessory protein HupE
LEVHTVLGSNTTDADTSRLRGLLSNALSRKNRAPAHPGIDPHNDPRHYLALVHPLYGQDFLDVYLPGRLGQEYKYASPA